MELKHLQISDSLEEVAQIAAVFLKQIENQPASFALSQQIEGLSTELKQTIAGRKVSEIESVGRTRRLIIR